CTIMIAPTFCRPPTGGWFSLFRFSATSRSCTTDASFTGDPAAVAPSGDEIVYLCGVMSEYFRAAVSPADVVWAFAGVRSLYDDGAGKPQDIGREYTLVLDGSCGEAPLLSVYGGKITTHRRLAEDVLDRLAHFFP